MGQSRLLENRWDDAYAATLDEPGKLLYRSNLLGADKRITNYGGGNTSAKVWETDPLTGNKVRVMWVKGSGGDVGTIKLDGFATSTWKSLKRSRASIAVWKTKTAWSVFFPIAHSISTRARPPSTRHCTVSCPSIMSITCIRTQSLPLPLRRIHGN